MLIFFIVNTFYTIDKLLFCYKLRFRIKNHRT